MSIRGIRSILAIAAAVAAGVALAADAQEPFRFASADEVEGLLGQPNVVVVDANHEDVYRKNHLPGAILLKEPLAKLLPPDKGRTLVFYCASPS